MLEVVLDRNAHSALALSGLLLLVVLYVCDMLWAQLKVDATLGHTIMGTLDDSGICIVAEPMRFWHVSDAPLCVVLFDV